MNHQPTITVLREGDGLKLRLQKIGVEVVAGPDKGRSSELSGPEVTVGSARSSDLVLKDRTVSRHHLTLRVEEEGLRVIDAGSRNTTILDGHRIRDAYALDNSLLELGNSQLRVHLSLQTVDLPLSSRSGIGSLIGESVAMRRMYGLIERVAPTDTTVLIEGATGTGKELVAEAIHELSNRADRPFAVLDCGAIPQNLIESHLFGHVKGAFSGAISDQPGAIEQADGGTLFLDEVAELSPEIQPRLLRFLEKMQLRRVGSDRTKKVDVRIVAATHRSLAAEVDAGRFREDLYYRLAVVRVPVPALKDRPDDIPLLVAKFQDQYSHLGKPLSHHIVQSFQARPWPGNVRELRNAVQAAISLDGAPGGAPAASVGFDFSLPLRDALDRLERTYVEEALRACDGNLTKAAELARINRKFFQRAVVRYGIREP